MMHSVILLLQTLQLIFLLKCYSNPSPSMNHRTYPQKLVTERGTEYFNQHMVHLCFLFNINHSPRTPFSPGPTVYPKSKIVTLELITCFYKTLPLIGHSKLKYLMLMEQLHFLNLNSLRIKSSSIHILVFL